MWQSRVENERVENEHLFRRVYQLHHCVRYAISSVKGGAHTRCLVVSLAAAFTQRILSPTFLQKFRDIALQTQRQKYATETMFRFLPGTALYMCGYGLGGFWFLPGPGSPGTSRVLMLHSIIFYLSVMCFGVCRSRYGIWLGLIIEYAILLNRILFNFHVHVSESYF